MSISPATPNVLNSGQQVYYGTSAPAASDAYGINFNVGDFVVNTSPSAGSTLGWVCTTAGTPGTWSQIGTGTVDAIYSAPLNANVVTLSFFLSGAQSYKVVGVTEVHSAAGTDAGAVTLDVTIDATTAAPGAGTSCLAAPFNLKATANVVQTATLAAATTILAGQRLSVKITGTTTAVAGVLVKAVLQKI